MNQPRLKVLRHNLQRIVQTLTIHYQPQKIILFGSMVAGDVGEWSDLDLVVIKETNKPFLQRLKEIALLCQSPVGVDFFVYTPDEFEQMVSEGNTFIIQEVLGKGKIVYERQPTPAMA